MQSKSTGVSRQMQTPPGFEPGYPPLQVVPCQLGHGVYLCWRNRQGRVRKATCFSVSTQYTDRDGPHSLSRPVNTMSGLSLVMQDCAVQSSAVAQKQAAGAGRCREQDTGGGAMSVQPPQASRAAWYKGKTNISRGQCRGSAGAGWAVQVCREQSAQGAQGPHMHRAAGGTGLRPG